MTAILNFTLPNLELSAGKAATTDASSSESRLQVSGGATIGDQAVADKVHGKEFSKLLNDRIVKKETAKEGKFDGAGQSAAETAEESAESLLGAAIPGDRADPIGNTHNSNGMAIELKLSADPELIKTDKVAMLAKSDAVLNSQPLNTDTAAHAQGKVPFNSAPEGIQSESGQPASRNEQGLRLGMTQSGNIVGNSMPAANLKSAASHALSENPTTQARTTAPIRSDDLPGTISLNAERTTDSQSPKGLPSAIEAEELIPEQLRQQRPVAADALTRTGRQVAEPRADGAVSSGNNEAEFAALIGKELPESGKPLPSVLTQTPAQYAPGLSGRAELMTRSVGNGRQRSVGKEAGEIAGLEKVAAADSRLPLSEMFGKIVSQVQPIASTETGMHAQSAGSDSPATGMLAQALAGVERAGGARAASQLTGTDASNTFSLQLQPGSQEMSAQLGSRIRWMGNLNISSAELKLYPAELGTLEILITAEDDQARVNFVTSTSAAKEMIEASLPRLRELLGQSGMLLEQGDVTHRDLSKNNSDSEKSIAEGQAVETRPTEALEQISSPMYQRSASDHRIDHFA